MKWNLLDHGTLLRAVAVAMSHAGGPVAAPPATPGPGITPPPPPAPHWPPTPDVDIDEPEPPEPPLPVRDPPPRPTAPIGRWTWYAS